MIRTSIRSLSQASRSVASSSSSSLPTSARSLQRFSPSALPKNGSSWSSGSFRGYASGPPPANTGRTLLILSAAAAGVGYIVYAKNGDGLNVSVLGAPLGMGTKPISESVLDQKTLKSSGLHSADSPAQTSASPNLPHNRPQSAPTSAPASVEAKATEASDSTQGAFNEETGEINWDCPCLGGMADGPCGEDFKAAFSCFVFSEAEPKGMDCVEKFKAMQDCFREHPDIYGEEIAEDEEQQAAIESSGETPEHPIPGNEPGDIKTPAQKDKGISLPKDQMPEHSFIKDVNPENSVKKGPVSSRG